MAYLLDQYRELVDSGATSSGCFNVTAIPGMEDHRLGLSEEHLPAFFIQCKRTDNDAAQRDYILDMVSVQFNATCQLLIDQQLCQTNEYTVIKLKSGSLEVVQYFLDIVYLMLSKLPQGFSQRELNTHVKSLIQLFTRLSTTPIKTIQGLWAELLIIDQAKDPDYILSAWHRSNSDKFDFNDGIDKIEVKSTSLGRRVHTFSAGQLMPNKSSALIIASVFTVETSFGKSIFDLSKNIASRIGTPSKIYELKEKIGYILGSDLERAGDVYFDYRQGIDSCSFFKSVDIPRINLDIIPLEIRNVRYECDLTGIKPTRLKSVQSKLFQSL